MDERIERGRFEVVTFEQAQRDDIAYWMSKSPAERIAGLEYLRRWAYGDAAIDTRLQRVFEIDELASR